MGVPAVADVLAEMVECDLSDERILAKIVIATTMVDDKIEAYLLLTDSVDISEANREQLILMMAAHECSLSEGSVLSEAGAGLSATYGSGDGKRFLAGFRRLWRSLTGASGGSYAVDKGWV